MAASASASAPLRSPSLPEAANARAAGGAIRTPVPPRSARSATTRHQRRNWRPDRSTDHQCDDGVADVLAALAAGTEVLRPPPPEPKDPQVVSLGGTADIGAILRQALSPTASPTPGLDDTVRLQGLVGEAAAAAGMQDGRSGGYDAPEPPIQWAARILTSAENVRGCLQTAQLRFSSGPNWSLADSDFVHIALPAVLSAAATQLQAAEVRKQELLREAEGLREHAAKKDAALEALRERIESQSWFPRQEHTRVEQRYKQAQERAAELEAKLAVAKAELHHLQSTVGESVNAEREALHRRREEITSERDARIALCEELRERLADTEDRLSSLQLEASSTVRAAHQAEVQAGLLPDTEAKFHSLQVVWTERQHQLAELQAKAQKKKKGGKKG